MCTCSFVRLAFAAFALVCGVFAQEYDIGDPNTDEISFNRARSADVALIFDEREIILNPGEELNLDCGVQGSSRYCLWEIGGTTYQTEDVYTNVYPGLSKPVTTEGNECGIVVNSANIQHHGTWQCKVFVRGDMLVGAKDVIVTIKPTSPILEGIDTSRGSLEVTDEEPSDIKCSVAAARPAVGIRWFLGNRDITASAEIEETPTDEDGIYKSISTLMHSFQPSENGQVLVCSISHQTLAVSENASVPISVIFKPIEKPTSTFYQIVPGSDYEVRLNFSANPVPTRTEWKYGEGFQSMAASIPVPGSIDRYQTSIEDIGNGLYTAKLYISGFTEADANQRYILLVENRLGETQYKVQLSMDEAPIDGDSETRDHDKIPPKELSVSEETLSGGAVAGIVIVVLIVVVAVVAAGYARYRQMFCFAPATTSVDPEEGKDIKEEHSDTESARGPNTTRAANLKNSIGKLTQVFKKPKKDQDTKPEEGLGGDDEKKYLTKGETNGSPKREQSPDEKEVVYAELDLSKGESEKKTEVKSEEKTEYAQIIGTVTDNKEDEKKE